VHVHTHTLAAPRIRAHVFIQHQAGKRAQRIANQMADGNLYAKKAPASLPRRSKKHDRLPDVQLNAAFAEVIFKFKETLDAQTKLPICSPFMHPVTDGIAPGCAARHACVLPVCGPLARACRAFLPCSQQRLLRARELNSRSPHPCRDCSYSSVVTNPMDLTAMIEKTHGFLYTSKEELLGDLRLIRDNCRAFNGEDHIYTNYAQRLVDMAGNDLKARAKQVSYLTQFARNEAERAKRFGGY
jgi:hypothetical protein